MPVQQEEEIEKSKWSSAGRVYVEKYTGGGMIATLPAIKYHAGIPLYNEYSTGRAICQAISQWFPISEQPNDNGNKDDYNDNKDDYNDNYNDNKDDYNDDYNDNKDDYNDDVSPSDID